MTRPRRSLRLLVGATAVLALVVLPFGVSSADGKPADPAKPAEPPKPADPAKPFEPPKPADPAKPVDPPKPADPAKPAEPPKPADPAKPAAVNPQLIEDLKVHGRVCPFIVQPPAERTFTKVGDANKELATLKGALRNRKSINEDLIASLMALATAYHNLAPDVVVEAPTGPEPTDPAEKKLYTEKKSAYEAAKAKFKADENAFRKDANDIFLDALKLVYVKPNSNANLRDDVNIKAAEILGFCTPHEDKLTDAVMKIMEDQIFRAKDYDAPETLVNELFKTVAYLNEKRKGFDEEFLKNWCKYSNNKGDPQRIKAMFTAVIEFRDEDFKDILEGKHRYDLVKKTLLAFVGPEAAAERGKTKEEQAQKQVWDTIKTAVVKALQWATREPKAKDGALIAKVKDFEAWFRDHDQYKPKDPVWADAPKVVGSGKPAGSDGSSMDGK